MNKLIFKIFLAVYTLSLFVILYQVSELHLYNESFIEIPFNLTKLWAVISVLTINILSILNTTMLYLPPLETIRLKDKLYAERLLKGTLFSRLFKWVIVVMHSILLLVCLYKLELIYSSIVAGLVLMQYTFIYLGEYTCKSVIEKFNDKNGY